MLIWALAAFAGEPVVVEAGREPAPLRYTLEKGSGFFTMEMSLTASMQTGEEPAESTTTPPMVLTASYKTKPVGEGKARVDLKFVDASVEPGGDPEIVAALDEALRALRGKRATMTVDARGSVSDLKMDLGELGSTVDLQKMTVPLPEAPVGVGAVWTVQQDVPTTAGMAITQVSTYTLKSRQGDEIVLDTSIVQTAPAGDVLGMSIVEFVGEGTGETTLDLRKIAPVASVGAVQVRIVMEGLGVGPIHQNTSVSLTIREGR